ncbi:hypothetical protein LP421_04820 (plasmid) [Rhizobium sp. RCAM05350]|nr:hypothetical protein LP421_04820 [Rhizobium sp. RCAM05350]
MTEAALKSGKVNLVNFSYRTWPGVELARQLIQEGELGDVLHFEGHFFQDYAFNPDLPFPGGSTNRFPEAVPSVISGSHIMDIACALMGPVESITARSRRLYEKRPVGAPDAKQVTVDDLTASLVQFSNGALGSVHASWAATGHKSDLSFSVTGTKGALSFSWERNNELHLFSAADPQRTGGFRRIMLGGIHPEADPFWYAQGQGLRVWRSFCHYRAKGDRGCDHR